jgi:hypothetical protein
MIQILEKAITEISKLPQDQQESFAQWILEELEDEQKWDSAFASSLDMLTQLGNKALGEFHSGLTQELDPDTLE